MNDPKRVGNGGSIDWSALLLRKEVAGDPRKVESKRGTGICQIDADLGDDPLAAVAKWKAERREVGEQQALKSELLSMSVQDALCAAKMALAKREIISKGRRMRSRQRMDRNVDILAGLQEQNSNMRQPAFWATEDRLASDRRADDLRYSSDEPVGSTDRDRNR